MMTLAIGCLTVTTSLGSCLIRCTSLAKTDICQRRPVILTRRSTHGQVNAVSCHLLPIFRIIQCATDVIVVEICYFNYLQYHSTVGVIVSVLCTSVVMTSSKVFKGATLFNF